MGDVDRDRELPPPPPRPVMTHGAPPPDLAPLRPTAVVRTLRVLWLVSFVTGATIISFAFIVRATISDDLADYLAELAPDRAEETLGQVAGVVLTAILIGIALVILVEALLLRGLLRRRGIFRWLLLAALPVQVVVAVLADAFLAVGEQALYIRGLLIVQVLLAAAAALAGVLPATAAWLAKPSERGRQTR